MARSASIFIIIMLALTNLFSYTYFTKQQELTQKLLDNTRTMYRDSVQVLNNRIHESQYFTFKKNENAINYMEDYDVEKLVPIIEENLIAHNDNPEGNPFTGMEVQLNGNKYIINKIQVINHRWIIADFSDGVMWGEAFIQYFLNGDNTIEFKVLHNVIYPTN